MRTLATALVFALLGQTPQVPKPTFETGVDIIQVDVHVVDRSGKPIVDLKPEDFEVEISGRKRKISTVQFISYAAPLPAAAGDPARPATAVTTHRPRRLYLLAVDEHSLHISNALAGVEAAERFIDRLQPDDLVGLHAFPTGTARHDFTTDHAAVKRALRGITGLFEEASSRFNLTPSEIIDIASGDQEVLNRLLRQHCSRGGCNSKDILNDAIGIIGMMEVKVSQSVGGLRSLVRGLGDIPGRKTVVLVSGGMVTTDRAGGRANAQAEIAALGKEVAAANCSLFALHLDWSFLASLGSKGGLRTSYFRDSNMAATGLEVVAGTAGGAVMRVQGTSPNVAFDRVLTETSAHYLLGVESNDGDRDGQAHPIRVKVKRGGVQVRSRTWVKIPPGKEERVAPVEAVVPTLTAIPGPPAEVISIVAPRLAVPANPEPTAVAAARWAVEDALGKAGAYLERYKKHIAAIVLEEDYVQQGIDELGSRMPVSRRLRSDVLVLADDEYGWVGFRDVFEVDGRRVRDREDRLATLFLKGEADPVTQARRIIAESTRFNLNTGSVVIQRSINLPMVALRYLVGENQTRSSFKSAGVKTHEGRKALVLEFLEREKPRIIATDDDAAVEGRFWLDPEFGIVMRSEIWLDTRRPYGDLTVSSRVRVNFGHDAKLGMWLPVSMDEQYRTGRSTMTGRATYSKPRRFSVATTEKVK